MPIGIGGIGDVIALLGIVRGFATALDGSRGSAAEYQEVRRELDGLEKALLCHHQLLQARCNDPALNAIFRSTQSTAEDCQRCIEAFSQQTVKFDRSLGVGKGGNVCRDITMKVRWQMSKREEVARFRAELSQHISTLNILFGMASLHMLRATNENIDSKLKDIEEKIDATTQAQESKVTELQESVDRGNSETVVAVTGIKEDLKLGWLHQLGSELKGIVTQIFTMSGTTLGAAQRIEQRLPSYSEMSLISTFTLEDALGRITRTDMMFVSSWEAFDAMLEGCFRDYPGHDKVVRKEYVFQDQKTNREIKKTMPWAGALKSGQYINMGLLFRKRSSNTKRFWCPYCHLVLTESQEGLIPCKCGNLHQRRLETVNLNEEDEMPAFDLPDGLSGEQNDHEPDYLEDVSTTAVFAEELPSSTNKTAEDMSCFKRIIIVEVQMNIIKTQKLFPVLTSSEEESNFQLDNWHTLNNLSFDEDSRTSYQYYTRQRSEKHPRSSSAYYQSDDADEIKSKSYNAYNSNHDYNSARPNDLASSTRPKGSRVQHIDSTREYLSDWRPKHSKKVPSSTRKATEADARNHGIPQSYSLKNWDPDEDPLMIAGSVFDCNSLGKWIYDWTVYRSGSSTPLSEMAAELWLLLIRLASKIQRAEGGYVKVQSMTNRELLDDFIESGDRLLSRLQRILKICETAMLRTASKRQSRITNVTDVLSSEHHAAVDDEIRRLEESKRLAEVEGLGSIVDITPILASSIDEDAPKSARI